MVHDDKEWRDLINGRISSLTSEELHQDKRLEDLEDEYAHIGEIEGQILELDRKVNELRAVMLPDSLGHGGVISRLKNVEDAREEKRDIRKERIKAWAYIAVTTISTAGFIFKEWPDISARWSHNMEELTAPREGGIKVKHKHKHVEVPEDSQEGSD